MDFGESLNDVYANLVPEVKKEFDNLTKQEDKLQLLKIIADPDTQSYYDKLSSKEKKDLDDIQRRTGYRSKYLRLYRDMLEAKKKATKNPTGPLDVIKAMEDREITNFYNNLLDPSIKQKIDKIENPAERRIQLLELMREMGVYNYKFTHELPLDTQAIQDVYSLKSREKEDQEYQNETPEDFFEKDEIQKKDSTPKQKRMEELVREYMLSNPYVSTSKNSELEVRFGTRGIKRLTKNDYDNVIKKIKSFGFISNDEEGYYRLGIQNEFLDKKTGTFKMSNVRTEITGMNAIQVYCRTNSLTEVEKTTANVVSFTQKNPAFSSNVKLFPVDFDDFNFRISYQIEDTSPGSKHFIKQNWKNSKKTFRFINRVTFRHPYYPVQVDISITKATGRNEKYYNISDSGVFTKPETYEIELEVINSMVGPKTEFNRPELLTESLRKVIKFVLSGLQGTNFPVSYPEQENVLISYMKMLNKEKYVPHKYIHSGNFIGPSSFTLQMENIEPLNEYSNVPNIRKQFTVTDKADGERHMLFIHGDGKIYLINTNMSVIFTGIISQNEKIFNSLLDGELIYHDKTGKFINLYAAFDIYYYNNHDMRALPFIQHSKEKEKNRYIMLKKVIEQLDAVSVLQTDRNEDNFKNAKKSMLPIRITYKKFYPENIATGNIFDACYDIMEKVNNQLFEYNTDGLIFTPAFLGVGSDKIGEAGPLKKVTWNHSFKWKPPKFNTIDFLVTTVKAANGTDVVKPIFEDGTNMLAVNQLNEYKIIQLRCTYSERKHGSIYLNPCQDIIEDRLPEYKSINYEDKNTNDAIPLQFYPTKPYDPTAGICNIMLRRDLNNVNQMFTEENEIFEDNTIVEFSYDFTKESGWRWVPLRVRHDKTGEMLQGAKNYGNAYHVADSNWKSIHNPITEEMIVTGENIPEMNIDDDVYYNKNTNNFKTQSMKDFHNLYVKMMLITKTSKRGDTLIDFACGKAGDLSKWIAAHLSFVFGIDVSKDNLENRLDGACVRYLQSRKKNKNMPYALFVNGDSAYNIINGTAMRNDKAVQITQSVFGVGVKDEEKLGKGVARQYGKGQEGFNVASCQFATHYFFENPEKLQGFMRNISECTKIGGHFMGTCYDGKLIFNLLKKTPPGEGISIIEDGKKIWEIIKEYNSDDFNDDSSSIGYKISVFQESINNTISEYLVNFDYLTRIMEDYGFKLLDKSECKEMGLSESSGLFSDLFANMMEEIKRNKNMRNNYGTAFNMTSFEKKISFLNRYFVFKKVRNVNTEKIQMDLSEYSVMDVDINNFETEKAVEVITKIKTKPKIKKLNKKIIILEENELEKESVKEPVKELEKESVKELEKESEPVRMKPKSSKKTKLRIIDLDV